jgi:hypothetical protein
MRRVIGISAVAVTMAMVTAGAAGRAAEGAQGQGIRLVYGDLTSDERYRLRDEAGDASAVIELFKGPLFDEDGNEIGVHRCQCINGSGFGWTCTHIFGLRPGPYTARGTVVITGLFRGFNGERNAITGGTGAYAGAAGFAIASVDDDAFVHTLYLMPANAAGGAS